MPQPLHIPSPRADRHARRRQLPASCGNFLPLLCHSRKDVIGVRAPLEEKLKTLLGCLSGTGHVTVCSLNCYFVKVTSDTHHPLLLVENSLSAQNPPWLQVKSPSRASDIQHPKEAAQTAHPVAESYRKPQATKGVCGGDPGPKQPALQGSQLYLGGLFGFVLFVCVFLGPHPRHREVPRLGVESEL